ncbi:glycine--tRNA ligase subunit beta [Sinirhodobacter sp. WL0062]|uniref:Glycine--tRNA ligase beta subunit n=1 Tax=Rhodobacter flavimaris TaxID=2907145 RepID=A0ABS8YRZ3_9RHOB|nr:glycine--tRNA ligase subunit beta [Sinirhodobacter sp. WL0062]MCE5972657.1 glycine--tRNA ligase subunit beta [Sinirhodobacter sp. WL0062]
MADLLIELFSEEIPARMQKKAREDLKKLVTDGLVEAGLHYAHAEALSTPRRLCLAIEGLSLESPTLREERKGPATSAPEKAIEGFLRSTGLTLEQLEVRDDKKGQVYFAVVEKPGRAAPEIVAEVLEKTIRNFPWPKSMRWGAGSLRWVRPLHSILCILSSEAGAEVVPLDVDGIVSGNTTEGHRFMAPGRFAVSSFDDYAAKLKAAKVILDSAEREEMIWHEAKTLAFARGLELVEDAGLLAEVAGLVEWPVALMGDIADQFLALPPEVLQTSMKEHQKFFSVKNPKTGRIEGFVTVANRETADHGATILKGNLKVLSARLSDAKFFWEHDLRIVKTEGLEGMGAGLANVTFHNKLGSQAARIERIEALAREIAPLVGASPDLAAEAARVVKADLRSAMVGEFPELQGLMGSYYARAAGLPEAVAAACKGHYSPLGPSDEVPSEPVTVAVALADKIDTLTGFWAIDEKPTGSKDPFALRRAALGVIRLVLANGVRVNLLAVLEQSILRLLDEAFSARASGTSADWLETWSRFGAEDPNVPAKMLRNFKKFLLIEFAGERLKAEGKDEIAELVLGAKNWNPSAAYDEDDLISFFHDRLKVHLRDEGIRHDVIDAVLAMPGSDDLTLVVKRAEALSAFLKTEDGGNLIQGFKRANNILSQAEAKDGVEYSFGADAKFAESDEERALFAALDAAEAAIGPAMQAEEFGAAMGGMAALRAPIDAFFEAVQINSDNEIVRRNRLNLLSRIRQICLSVADLTRIEG